MSQLYESDDELTEETFLNSQQGIKEVLISINEGINKINLFLNKYDNLFSDSKFMNKE